MKILMLADIHFGLNSNSDEFNQQCLDFLDFVEESSQNYDIDCCIFLGDYWHNRNNINTKTLKYGIEGLFKLGSIGNGKTYMLAGNHDLFYKDKRDVTSLFVPEGDLGIEIIDEPIYLDKERFLLCPWLVGEENLKDLIQQYKPEYVFGHFELPSFPLNRQMIMEGEFNPEDYRNVKHIFSGHFHTRNNKGNITYIGNCFSHNFSDVNDWNNKGYAILNTETNEIKYFEWQDAPKFCITKISKLNEIKLGSNLHLKLINDIDMKPLQLQELKEGLENMPQIKSVFIYPLELELSRNKDNDANLETITNISDLITSLLSDMDIKDINNNKLIQIFNNLI